MVRSYSGESQWRDRRAGVADQYTELQRPRLRDDERSCSGSQRPGCVRAAERAAGRRSTYATPSRPSRSQRHPASSRSTGRPRSHGAPPVRNLPTFLANNKFAYAINNFRFLDPVDFPDGSQRIFISTAKVHSLRERTARLNLPAALTGAFPLLLRQMTGYIWFPLQVTADPTQSPGGRDVPLVRPAVWNDRGPQLASFTVDSQGNLIAPTPTKTCHSRMFSDVHEHVS